MVLPTSGIKLGEVRRDPADGKEYRFVTDEWVLNTPATLEPLASSAGFPDGTEVGEVRKDANTGVLFSWNGSSWVLVTLVIPAGLGDSVSVSELDSDILRRISVTITPEQIMSDIVSGITLIPAVAGKQTIIKRVWMRISGGTQNYDFDGMMGSPKIGNSSYYIIQFDWLLNSESGRSMLLQPYFQTDIYHGDVQLIAASPPTQGNRTIRLDIEYALWDV